jgi:hypothetical protein
MGLDPRFAFWRLPRRVERLAIHVLVLDEQLAQLGQTVGGLVAEKRVAREAELNDAFLSVPDNGTDRRRHLAAEEDAAGIVRMPDPVGGFITGGTKPLMEEQHGA